MTAIALELRALRAMRPKSIWVQMATIGVDATEHLATEVRTRRPSANVNKRAMSPPPNAQVRGPKWDPP